MLPADIWLRDYIQMRRKPARISQGIRCTNESAGGLWGTWLHSLPLLDRSAEVCVAQGAACTDRAWIFIESIFIESTVSNEYASKGIWRRVSFLLTPFCPVPPALCQSSLLLLCVFPRFFHTHRKVFPLDFPCTEFQDFVLSHSQFLYRTVSWFLKINYL